MFDFVSQIRNVNVYKKICRPTLKEAIFHEAVDNKTRIKLDARNRRRLFSST